MILLQALEHMRRQTSRKLAEMKQDKKFAAVDWKMLNEYLPDHLLEELDEKNKTNIRQQLSFTPDPTLVSDSGHTHMNPSEDHKLPTIPTVNQTSSVPNSRHSMIGNRFSKKRKTQLPTITIEHNDEEHNTNIRNELIIRFLTAMSIDYEKQWYLGMIRRTTLNILIQSVHQAKQKNSFELHWKLIQEHFRLSIFLKFLIEFNYLNLINRYTNQLFFDHIFRTIELTLSKFI